LGSLRDVFQATVLDLLNENDDDDDRIIYLMKLMSTTMLSAAIKRQCYSCSSLASF